jgi:hypothetical protein
MNNLLILAIGGTGQGKTSFVRKITEGKPLLLYDVNGEHSDLTGDTTQARSRYFGDPADFIELCRHKHGNTYCVFEEATGFLMGTMQKDMRAFCVAKRHPVDLGGRSIIMLFHTIASVPPFLLDMADMIVLFKTGDSVNEVKRKRPKLLEPYLKLQTAPRHSKLIIKNI